MYNEIAYTASTVNVTREEKINFYRFLTCVHQTHEKPFIEHLTSVWSILPTILDF